MTTPSTPDPDPGPAGPFPSAGETSYADAQAELDAILRELDGDEVDVDVLGERVRRAAELLRLCRDRIAAARFEVEQVVGELEAEVDAGVVDDFDEAEDHEDDEDLDDEHDGADERDEAEHDDAELAGWSAGDEP